MTRDRTSNKELHIHTYARGSYKHASRRVLLKALYEATPSVSHAGQESRSQFGSFILGERNAVPMLGYALRKMQSSR